MDWVVRIVPIVLIISTITGCGTPTDRPTERASHVAQPAPTKPRRISLPPDLRPLTNTVAQPAEHSVAPVQQTEDLEQPSAVSPQTDESGQSSDVFSPTTNSRQSAELINTTSDTPNAGKPDGLPSTSSSSFASIDEAEPVAADSVVPWARPVTRPERITRAVRQADQKTRSGVALAQRGSRLAARAEFIQALRLIAEAMDEARDCRVHRQSLARGLAALTESSSLVRGDSRIETNRSLAETVAGHETQILSDSEVERLTFGAARQRYFDYSREQLAAAVAGEPVGSMALYGLGRAQAIADQRAPDARPAMTLYRAALSVDGRNFLASNELGVQQARLGDYPAARMHLLGSWQEGRQAMTLKNLVLVHRRLGERQLAAEAARLLASMNNQSPGSATSQAQNIRWMDPAAFARTNESASPVARSAATPTTRPPANTAPPQPTTGWLPWKPKRR